MAEDVSKYSIITLSGDVLATGSSDECVAWLKKSGSKPVFYCSDCGGTENVSHAELCRECSLRIKRTASICLGDYDG